MRTPQRPIGSGFHPATTTSDVIRGVDLVGRVAIVTGGHAGLGLETARTLALAGARVIVPARDVERARRAIAEVGGGIEVQAMDLTDPQSIDAFARRFVRSGLSLHILVNSAGIMALPTLERDGRGHELQFSTNHLGHFQLTARLWPALVAARGARVVSVSSLGHRSSRVVFDDVDYHHRPYDRWTAYGQSKTANALFAVALDARGREHGVRAFSLHPGGIVTGLVQHLSRDDLRWFGSIDEQGEPVIDPARDLKSIPQGAATQVWCAVSPQLEGMGGVFCTDCDVTRLSTDGAGNERAVRVDVEPHAVDTEDAERLWHLSTAFTGADLGR